MKEDSATIGSIVREFWDFLKAPTYHEHGKGFSLRIALALFFSFSVLRFLGIVLEVNGFRPFVLYFTGQELQKQEHPDLGLAHLLVGSLVSAPLFEEIAYRWGLRFSPVRTAVSIGLVVFYWLPFGGTYSTASIVGVLHKPGFYLMAGMALVAGLTSFALLRISYINQKSGHWWRRHFGWVFYGSSLLFGFMHIFNVSGLSLTIVSLVPFITFQQTLLGLFNGYVRMKYGFTQAVVQHALFNLVPVIVQLSSP